MTIAEPHQQHPTAALAAIYNHAIDNSSTFTDIRPH